MRVYDFSKILNDNSNNKWSTNVYELKKRFSYSFDFYSCKFFSY